MIPLSFDPTLPICVPGGHPVHIICTDRKGLYPIVALITQATGEETLHYYHANGTYQDAKFSPPLSNVPEKGYINLWYAHGGKVWCSDEPYNSFVEAKESAGGGNFITIGLEIDMPVEKEKHNA